MATPTQAPLQSIHAKQPPQNASYVCQYNSHAHCQLTVRKADQIRKHLLDILSKNEGEVVAMNEVRPLRDLVV